MRYILDACALIALLNREEGWETVRELLIQASAGNAEVFMNSVNLLEVYYDRLRLGDAVKLDKFLYHAFESPIHIIDTLSRPMLDEAARIKAFYKRISLADAVGLATTLCTDGIFVTADHHELDTVDRSDTIRFLWIR